MALVIQQDEAKLWRPSATLDSLRSSATVRSLVRQWMQKQNILEVSTPALSSSTSTDPHLNSFRIADSMGSVQYLHTSPEFAMKRLLAAFGVDIYQLATVFRATESGRFHNPEFCMLEWYRLGLDHHALTTDVECLLEFIWQQLGLEWLPAQRVFYCDLVENLLQRPFEELTVDRIEHYFKVANRSFPATLADDLDAALALLLDEFILPQLAPDRATFVMDYPASQAAMACLTTDANGRAVAERFEVYWGRCELANGYHELTDAKEQRQRFANELEQLTRRDLEPVQPDHNLLAALDHGMPACAGVALGFERLVMVLLGADRISEVLAFDGKRA